MATIQDIRHRTQFTNKRRSLSAIKNIARHYSATASGDFDAFWNHWNGKLGWGTGGYHEIILRDGTVQLCYDPEQITNGVGGQNSYIYNICLVSDGAFTAAQEKAWEERAKYWIGRLGLPVSAVKGHNEFPGQSTACPGIDMNIVRARLNGQAASPPVEKSYLEHGDKGDKIKEFQEKLKRAGYEIEVDGSFGPAMLNVVKRFQRDNNLTIDGYLGPDTQKTLSKVVKDMKNAKEVDELTQYMDEKLPPTQQKDAEDLFKQAYADKYFSVDHSPKVKNMTRREFHDLKLSLEIRGELNKKVK